MLKKALLISMAILLVACLGVASAVEVTCYSSEFVKGKGKPVGVSDSFPGMIGSALLKVYNGDDDNLYNRISSSIIKINSVDVFKQNDFNQTVEYLESEIILQESNTISVEVRGKSGGKIKVEIVQEVGAEAAVIIGNAGGTVKVEDKNSSLYGVEIGIPETTVSKNSIIT